MIVNSLIALRYYQQKFSATAKTPTRGNEKRTRTMLNLHYSYEGLPDFYDHKFLIYFLALYDLNYEFFGDLTCGITSN